MTDPLLAEADALYALGAGEFTAARDVRVRELRPDRDLAARVKALRRPTIAAWVVNLLVRREADQVAQVLAVGEALRQAQADLDAGQLREFTRQRRQLTAAVSGRARALATQEGVRLTEAVREQVEATLTAAMLDPDAARAVRSGLMVTGLSATGIEPLDVAAAVAVPEALGFTATPQDMPEPGPPDLRVVPDPDADAKARRAAEEALAEAEELVRVRAADRDTTQADVDEASARGLQLQAELDELRRRVAEVEAAVDDVDEELAAAEAARDDAVAGVAEAERERDEAARRVAMLEG